MRTHIFVLLTSLLLSSLISQSMQQSPELKEASDLSLSVVKLFKEGKFDEAIPLAKRALEIRERLLPTGDPMVLTALGNLGNLYNAKGDYRAAKKSFDRLLALQEQQFGPTDVKLASTLDLLAVLHYRERNVSKAEETYQRALALRENAFGPDHVEVANSLFALAHLYRLSSKYEPALNAYRRSLSIYSRAKGVELAAYERARAGMTCLAYETEKKEIFNEINALPKLLVPGIDLPKPEDILNGKALDLPKPEYPPDARARRLFGTVVIRVEINEEGKVFGARDLCQGPPFLSEAAVNSAMKARFTPTLLYGQPIKVTGAIVYHFRDRP
ncbi:MAG TPA: TonB family protein [Pyrinomonadaceae bacterium]|nr:TonB family protein [Pyrinomonadaceae bacterium]